MTVRFLDVTEDQCRTPRWSHGTPIDRKMVCGAPTLLGRTYCAACRETLIAGEIKNGRTTWFTGSRATMNTAEPGDRTDDDVQTIWESPDLGSEEVTTDFDLEEDEAEGTRPLLPSDLYDVEAAA